MKKILKTACRQWAYQLRSADFWVVLIAIGIYFSSFMKDAREAAEEAGEQIGIFGLFPVSMMDYFMIVTVAIGLLFLVTDIPVHMPDNDFRVLRMDRGTWYCVQWVYLFLIVSTYSVFIWLAELLCCLPHLAFTGGWGGLLAGKRAMNDVFGSFIEPVVQIPDAPAAVMCMAGLLLFVLFGMLLGGVCLVCNMHFASEKVGIFACAAVILAYAMENANYIRMPGILSPLSVYQNFWELTPITFVAELGYFLALCILLYTAGQGMLYKIDLKGETKKA